MKKNLRFIIRPVASLAAVLGLNMFTLHSHYQTNRPLTHPATLLRSAECGNIRGLDALLGQGSSIESADDRGYTPLLYALASEDRRSATMVQHLLNLGADPSVRTTDGHTALSIIELNERIDVAPAVMRALWQQRLTKPAPHDISFIIADIKFDKDGHITILEFGEGARSQFKGHDALGEQGLIWQRLWDRLAREGVAVWSLDNSGAKAPNDHRSCRLDYFKSLGGRTVASTHLLERDPAFQAAVEAWREKGEPEEPSQILLLRNHRLTDAQILQFRQRNPSVLVVGEAVRPFVSSKFMTSLLFDDDQLRRYHPAHRFYKKSNAPELAAQIAADFPDDKLLVIKPLSAANGWGIVITPPEQLATELERMFGPALDPMLARDTSYSYWRDDRRNYFMVESYASSKKISYRSQAYDATMRQVMILRHACGRIDIEFIGSYWKLPAQSIHAAGSPTQRLKSQVRHGRTSSRPVSTKDDEAVQRALRRIMPLLYKKMLCAL